MMPGDRRRRAAAPPRVVLDTNLVLSALVFRGGSTGSFRKLWQQGGFMPLVSPATVQELMRVLAYPKFGLFPDEQQELLADYLPYARAVRIPQPPPAVPRCRDPDLPFLELAIAGSADFLVSGDKDLLALRVDAQSSRRTGRRERPFEGGFSIPIVAPAAFLGLLHEVRDDDG